MRKVEGNDQAVIGHEAISENAFRFLAGTWTGVKSSPARATDMRDFT
jgi:hypothetical protein